MMPMETGSSKIHGEQLGEKEGTSEWPMVIHVVSARTGVAQ